MTNHQAERIAAIVELHNMEMRDPTHRLLCCAEPCNVALLLDVVSTQARALLGVKEIAAACQQTELWAPRRGMRLDARKTVEVFKTISDGLNEIVQDLTKQQER
jgi:hypothetical protein